METASNLINSTTAKLINYIIDNNLQAGDKLPNEIEIAQLFKVGRSTVREAVKALVGRNVLEVRQGAGTFLAQKQIGITDDPLGFAFIKDKKKLIYDLLEVRLAIEPRIAAFAAANATAQDLAKMKNIMEEMQDSKYKNEYCIQKDVELHAAIAISSGNLIAPNIIPIIQRSILLFMNAAKKQSGQGAVDAHKTIIEAIENRDAIGAAEAMAFHIIYSKNRIRRFFTKATEN
jgi:DNA-binding FadR family transcriptional regulator